jgi:hypothetical protein
VPGVRFAFATAAAGAGDDRNTNGRNGLKPVVPYGLTRPHWTTKVSYGNSPRFLKISNVTVNIPDAVTASCRSDPVDIRPGKSQLNDNVERVSRTVRYDWLGQTLFDSIAQVQEATGRQLWLTITNAPAWRSAASLPGRRWPWSYSSLLAAAKNVAIPFGSGLIGLMSFYGPQQIRKV